MSHLDNPIRVAVERLPGKWMKGDLDDPFGNSCGIGHLYHALDETHPIIEDNDQTVFSHLAAQKSCVGMMKDAAKEVFPERIGNGNFVTFNDHHDTTEIDVIAVMDKAADRWDELHD